MNNNVEQIYNNLDAEEVMAKDIVIPEFFPAFFISKREVLCYTGVLLNDENDEIHLQKKPYYFSGRHSTEEFVAKQVRGFFRLEHGRILLDDFIDTQYTGEEKYKKLDVFIQYPVGADIYYEVGIRGNHERGIQEELTRIIFGLTCVELQKVIQVYAKIFGIYNDYIQYPRLTRYQRDDSYCDICNMWIPKSFPYIIFNQSGYDFSHVSLWGFYRHLQLLLNNNYNSPMATVFLNNGIENVMLDRILSIKGLGFLPIPMVTKITKEIQ